MDQDIETQEEHLHPPIRRIANLQPGIYKTPQTTVFTPRKNTQHTLLSPPIIMFCNFRRLCRFCRLCKFCRFGRFCNFCRLCRKNAFTYLFDELRIDNLESTKHPRHPFLLHDKYATLLSLHTIRFRNFCRNLQSLQTPQNSQNLQILHHIK